MKFKPGTSGNPYGRPKGSRNTQTKLIKLLELHAEKLINKMVAEALDGDPAALRLCIERLLPKARQKNIEIDPAVLSEQEIASQKNIFNLILNEILAGNINPDDGKKIISLIEEQRLRTELF
ncbi:DUF5681 domain-containing protein [Legionella gresilensis]|uniref:DUF5681 domain-containing protein n=1 Tax=Legionella gresilensis TaxID=91823 RepID=UPI001041A7AC|nr:DUF5681 domain-containing protein [Legionella gresilensis]